MKRIKVLLLAGAVLVLGSGAVSFANISKDKQEARVGAAILSSQTIRSVLLINADTDTSLGELTNGSVINTSTTKYTFQALTNPSTVGSVVFNLDGKEKSDSKAPYAFYRDNGHGNFYPANLSVGEHLLIVTPWTKANASGTPGQSVIVRFTVTDSASGVPRSLEHPANNLKVFLGGPYDVNTGLMSSALNDGNLIPLLEPYTALGYTLTSGAGSSISPSVLDVTGSDAIVDWVVVELRSAANNTVVSASRPALVEADGDVVGLDGVTPIFSSFTPGPYYVAVYHRNHLAVMIQNPMDISSTVDLSIENLYGTNAAKTVAGIHALWPGDTNNDHKVQYTGSGNDKDAILVSVGSATPNNQVSNSYSLLDTNMDGIIRYTGSGNDRDVILVTVGGTSPTNIQFQQIPAAGASGNSYYASPTGTGNGLTVATPFKISNFWSVAHPGDTLWLTDGTYTGSASMITPPENLSGTAGNPITVKAINDGMVKINGGGVNTPAALFHNDFFVLEGFDAYNSSASDVSIGYSSNNIVRRVVAWDAGNVGDHNVFGVHHGTGNTLEDVAGFGGGNTRKVFSNSQEGNNTTFRRAFGTWNGSIIEGPKKTFAFSYNSYGALCENCIGNWNSTQMQQSYNLLDYSGNPTSPVQSFTNYQVQQPSGIFGHDGFDQSFLNAGNSDNANIRIYGSIAYLKGSDRFHNVPSPARDWAGPTALEIKGVEYKNNVSYVEPGYHTNIWNPYMGDVGVTGFNSATQSTFIGGEGAHINNKWSTSNNYTSSSCGSVIANGGNIVNHQGTLTGGATITKRYEGGVLTNDDLWPWPMNQRILNAMTFAGYANPIDVTATISGLCGAQVNQGLTLSQIVTKGQQWLASTGSARTALEADLSAWTTNIDQAVGQIRPHDYVTAPTGEVFNQHFSIPSLVSRYPAWNDPSTPATESYTPEFNMVVPPNYNPSTPIGLMFFLHWGGSFGSIELDYPGTTDPNDSYITEWVLDDEALTGRSVVRTEADNSNYIVVAPVAPFGTMLPDYAAHPGIFGHASRWDVPSADQYLMDIITEIASRYNIDYNKIVVTGTSMGGIGAYHMAHRLNDRLAAVMGNGISWTLGEWGSLTDLPIYTIQGTNDAYFQSTTSCRNHMTDISFARTAEQLMSASPIHTLTEYPQIPGHGFDTSTNSTEPGHLAWKNFINGTSGIVNNYTRNPYRSHVIAINPWRTYQTGGNFGATWNEDASPNTMWLSVNQYGNGTIPYNRVTPQGDGGCTSQANWNNWSLLSDTVNLPGGKAEATISGNTVNITTNNVTNLSVWLHPNMVNFSQPITLNINGNAITRTCSASLLTALKSYERRQDWNMIYTCELPVTINASGVPTP